MCSSPQVSPAVGIISPGQSVEVTLQHGQLRSQDYLAGTGGTSGNSSGADQEKAVTLLVIITGVYSTAGRDHRIHVQHHSRRGPFPSRGYNIADRFFG